MFLYEHIEEQKTAVSVYLDKTFRIWYDDIRYDTWLTPQGKDFLQRRIIGIVNTIEPTIKVEIDFIKKDSKNVVRITVSRPC